MALKDVLTKQTRYKHPSWLEQMKETLESADYEWLVECLRNTRDFSGSYIAEKMTQAGHPVSVTTINTLRKTLRG